jgi:hydroxysqualene dehydroxylase
MSLVGRVAVVGAGWAGLACAVELTAAGRRVTVFEAARQAGGRARAVDLDGQRLDNGQHLLVGAYSETRRLMRHVGADPDRLFDRVPLRLDYPGHFRLQLPDWPAPLHLAAGLLAANGASLREKLSAAAFMQRLKRRRFRLERDTSVADWLDAESQTGTLRRFLWEPLCLAALNTAPAIASAQVFANVLRDSLAGGSGATDLLLPRTDLGRLFPDPAAAYLAAHGSELRLSARVENLEREGNGWRIGSETFDHVVLAVAPQHLARLLGHRPAHETLLAGLSAYAYEPIGTAYLGYSGETRLPFAMLGLGGPLGQWVFDRRPAGNPGILAFVFSGEGEWDSLDDDTLVRRLHDELSATIGPLPLPRWQRVIRERRATFSCCPGLMRPGPATAEHGLWLAGDYCYEDYPATLEGAVRSGITTARWVLGRSAG